MKKAKLIVQKEKENNKVTNEFSFKKLIITIVIIVAVLTASYFLTDVIVKKTNNSNNQEQIEIPKVREENAIKYSEINKIEDKSYYLLFDEKDDANNSYYDVYIGLLSLKGLSTKFYYIDLGDEDNKDAIGKETSLKEVDKLKVKGTTLVAIEDGKVKETYEGSDKVLNYLLSFFSTGEETSEDNSLKAEDTDSKDNK